MSLNWKEIELILTEADLVGSKIQGVIQNSFHSLTWELYKQGRGRFLFYTEVGTDNSRIHVLSEGRKLEKTKKLQRFIQFARKNIEGSVITECTQLPFDRVVKWKLDNHSRIMNIYIRLYSGSGANVIVTDESDKILDLLLRRPGRDEISGQVLTLEKKDSDPRGFTVREYSGSFNSFIEKFYSQESCKDTLESLRLQVEKRRDRELEKLNQSLSSAIKTSENNSDFDEYKKTADMLASVSYQIKRGDEKVVLHSWENNSDIVVKLDKSLSPGENVNSFYDKYQKKKGTYENAQSEISRLKKEIESATVKFSKALQETDNPESDIIKLKSILEKTETPIQIHDAPGIRCSSGGFEIIAGRNAKENDELLRHYVKGPDMWLHVRDFPGGYVFIKYKKDKTVPLEVLLDAANIAVLFSKARNNSSVDLYYTQVKHLRRVRNGKTGLVLPSQDKNLTIKPERSRIERLLPKTEVNFEYSD